MVIIPLKRCSRKEQCVNPQGSLLPATREYFNKGKRFKDGLYPQCKCCCKDYKDKHKEHRSKIFKEWRDIHRAEEIERCRVWRNEHKDYFHQWYLDHAEEQKTRGKKWREDHPERVRIRGKRYRERIQGKYYLWCIQNPEKIRATTAPQGTKAHTTQHTNE